MSITKDDFTLALPSRLHNKITPEFLERVNTAFDTTEGADAYRDNILSFTTVLQSGSFQLNKYVDAVKYVTYKLGGLSNIDAWSKTFPDRLQGYQERGADKKIIAGAVSVYNNSQLVSKILEQSLVPIRIYNQDKRQKAIDVLTEIMLDEGVSAKARVDAANSLLNNLSDPNDSKISVTVNNTSANDIIAQLAQAMNAVANNSRMKVVEGESTTREQANIKLINREVFDEDC